MKHDRTIEEARKLDVLFYKLIEDVQKSAEFWHDRGDGFARRTHIKTVFSLVEGVIQMLKTAAVLFDNINEKSVLSAEEIAMLKEEQPFMKSNGSVGIQKIKIPMLQNFKFALRSYAKVRAIDYKIDLGGQGVKVGKNSRPQFGCEIA